MTTSAAPSDGRWKPLGACAVSVPARDADPFFPTNISNPDSWETPRRVCQACPVRDLCLAAAMDAEAALATASHRFGMWGGLTPKERAELAKTTTDTTTNSRRRTA